MKKSQNLKENTSYKRLWWIFLVFMIFTLTQIQVISAFDFDNIGRYNETSRIFTIKNSILGIPFLQLGTVAEIELNSPDIVYVIKGKDRKVAEFTINNYGDYSNAFKKMEFYNIKNNMEKFDRDFIYKYKKSLGFETIDDYETNCENTLSLNGTEHTTCTRKLIGTHQEERFEWVELDTAKELQTGEITIGVFTDVYAGDNVEWIPTLFGVKINEWATWKDSFEIGLISYYKMDNSTGDAFDWMRHYDGTVDGTTRGVDGILGKSFNFSRSNTDFVNLSDINEHATGDEITVSAWINPSVLTDGNAIVNQDTTSTSESFYFFMSNNGAVIEFAVWNSVDTRKRTYWQGGVPAKVGEWTHVLGVLNETGGVQIYVNGTPSLTGESGFTGTIRNSADPVYIGHNAQNSWYFDGAIDEVGIWNRSLNASEIAELYNSGIGITPTAPPPDNPPIVTLNSPVNAFNTTSPTIDFNCTASDDVQLANVSLLINGTIVQTNSSGINGTQYLFTETLTGGAGTYNWTCQAFDNASQSTTASARNFTFLSSLAISLVSPVIGYNSTSQSITFNGTASDDTAVLNISLYIDGILNETNSSPINATYTLFSKDISDGSYNWTYEACDAVSCLSATTRNLYIDTIFPIINITYPTTEINYHTINENLNLNWTITDTNLHTCFFDYNGTNTTVTCSDNTTNINITDYSNRDVTFWANDTSGNLNSDYQEWNYLILENVRTFNSSSYETETETFYMNITTNGTIPTDVKLIYNGTSYSATVTNTYGNDYNISRAIDIPITAGTKTFFFNFTINGVEISSSNSTQLINATNFIQCTIETPFINISFKNETLLDEFVTATISSVWNYYLGSGTVFKTLSFSNASENTYYIFCLEGFNSTLETNVSLTYSNSISQQRTFSSSFSLTNVTTNQTLYLLPTTEGVFVTFQVINVAEQPISGVTSNVTKNGAIIASGTTDDAGTISYFLDPDSSYTFTFFDPSYELYTTTLTPTQTTFTITLGAEEVPAEEDYTRGITYSISPGTVSLINNTNTYFNFTLTSAYWTVQEFGFNLTNENGTLLSSTSALTNGGTVFILQNTSNYTTITMTFFWTISGNVSIGSTFWAVLDSSGTGFGLTTFASRLATYLDTEMFGLNSNSLVILIYIIIFITTGIMSFKYGIRSPATISLMIFGLAFLFEVHLGWIPSISGFPILTILFALISIGLITREGLK